MSRAAAGVERPARSWSTSEHETEAGAVESRQWITLPRQVVPADDAGARELGRRYLAAVARFSHGLVRPRPEADGVALVLAGIVPLLRFGSPGVDIEDGRVECRYAIRGGALVARPGGSLVISQRPGVELELVVAGYFPRLGGATRRRSLRRALYTAIQARSRNRRPTPRCARARSRAETGRRLAAGPVPVTTLRAGMVVGRGSAAFEAIRALVDRLPAMICPRWVSTPTQPIALRDVVHYLAAVCGLEAAHGESFDVGGPDVMTYREMIERIARIRGKRLPIVEVPVLIPRLSSWWLHLVTPVNASVARPLIDGLRTPTVVRDNRIREMVPIDLTPFDDAVRDALRTER